MVSKLIPALSGMSLSQLTQALSDAPPYRAKQIFSWIARGARSFDEMTNLSQEHRKKLAENYVIRKSAVSKTLKDKDGTVKLRLALEDGDAIETVLLRTDAASGGAENSVSKSRYTACLSTQAGCPVGCVFCKTGALGFKRNLDAAEIIEQFLYLSDIARKEGQKISNIVIMGMGEPLLNLNNLRLSLDILGDSRGVHISRRKITVSTSGAAGGILEMAEHGPEAELALSLTSAREALRNRLMPGAQNDPLAEIKKALRVYREKQGRRITVEMVLLKGINTTEEEAASLAAFAKDLGALVNLIPWNPVEGLSFEGKPLQTPEEAEIGQFQAMLEQRGIHVTRRYRRGRGIGGACGQLGG
jgi:23S rRNA (adenine2503-C2)-methyltransferase